MQIPSTLKPQSFDTDELVDMKDCLERGDRYLHSGCPGKSLSAYKNVLKIFPTHPLATLHLGTALFQTGKFSEAKNYFITATQLMPNNASPWNNLGVTHKAIGNIHDAQLCFEKAIELEPSHSNAHINLGNIFTYSGDYTRAIHSYKSGVLLDPNNSEAWCNLSVCLKEHTLYSDAINAAWRAHTLDPSDFRACAALGTAILNSPGFRLPPEIAHKTSTLIQTTYGEIPLRPHVSASLAWLYAAVERNPHDTDALRNIASIYDQQGFLEKAKQVFEQLLDLDPEDNFSVSRVLDIEFTLCNWSKYKKNKNRMLRQIRQNLDKGAEISADIINLLPLKVSDEFIAQVAQHKSHQIAKNAGKYKKLKPAVLRYKQHTQKLRIGYLVPYTRFSSMTHALKNIISQHNKDRFSIHGFCIQTGDLTHFDRKLRGAFDTFHDIPISAPQRAAQIIEEECIDILIDTAGHTATNCLSIMALRPAPVQAHYLGYGLTSGSNFIDFLITDEVFIPIKNSHLCTERLVYLPHCFLPASLIELDKTVDSRADHGLPEGNIIFCNFNQPAKFEPTTFSIWMKILQLVPDSSLWLGAWNQTTRRNLAREAKLCGVHPDRLVFGNIVSRAQHMRRLTLADLALDTLYHGGGLTSMDILQAGVPLLTCTGPTPQSRLGTTLLKTAGLPELIAKCPEEFVKVAVTLARQPKILRHIRYKTLNTRLTSPLFDQGRYVRYLEDAFFAMWQSQNSYRSEPIFVQSR